MALLTLSSDYFRNILEFVDLFDNVSFQLTCKYFKSISKECIPLHIACCKAYVLKLSNEEYVRLSNEIKSHRTFNKNLLMDSKKISLILDNIQLFSEDEITYYTHYAVVSDFYKNYSGTPFKIERLPKISISMLSKLDTRLTRNYENMQNLYDLSVISYLTPRDLSREIGIVCSNVFLKMWFYSMPSFSKAKEADFQYLDKDDKKNEMFICYLIKHRKFSFLNELSVGNYGRVVHRRLLPANTRLIGRKDSNFIEALIDDNRPGFYELIRFSKTDDTSLVKYALTSKYVSITERKNFASLALQVLKDEIYLHKDKKLLGLLLRTLLPKNIETSSFFNDKDVLLKILKFKKSVELLHFISNENFKKKEICLAIFAIDNSTFPLLLDTLKDDSSTCLTACIFNQEWFSLISDRLKQNESFIISLASVIHNDAIFLLSISQTIRNNPEFWVKIPEAMLYAPIDILNPKDLYH